MSRRTKAIALGLTVLTAGAFAAWAMHERIPLQQYRTVPAGDSIPTFDDGAELNAAVATQPVPSIEIHRKLNEYAYAIASVEFTDQGFFWDERQLWKAAAYIRDQISSGRGAVVVTFAHGWNNNAAPDNQNAACFQEVLKAVSTLQASYHGNDPAKAPAVVGVYSRVVRPRLPKR